MAYTISLLGYDFAGLIIACFLHHFEERICADMSQTTWIYQCLRPDCRFRFPVAGDVSPLPMDCPKCGSPTRSHPSPNIDLAVARGQKDDRSNVIEVLLDNIRSSLNVGSIIRTSDGAGVSHIYVCGITPTPDHPKTVKSALGAQFSVPWSQHWDALEVCENAKSMGKEVWVLEGGKNAISIYATVTDLPSCPILLVVGSEVTGVDSGIIAISDRVIHIPMYGSKGSLNVSVAYGIAVYTIIHSTAHGITR
jgi:23S rRNA (guanosine2251-2'-O)-methyltransferase